MVAAGELRFFLGQDWGPKTAIATWLQRSCRVVALPGMPPAPVAGLPAGPGGPAQGVVLYDCGYD
jgi:hypothetical protein